MIRSSACQHHSDWSAWVTFLSLCGETKLKEEECEEDKGQVDASTEFSATCLTAAVVDSPVSSAPKHTHRVQSIHPPDEPITERSRRRVSLSLSCSITTPPSRKPKPGMRD